MGKDLKHDGVQVLPRNIEQLVTDCLDEGQYQVALTFLNQVMGPTVVPSAEVIRQVLVLACCKPDRRPRTRTSSHLRRRKKRKNNNGVSLASDSLPDNIPPQVVSRAFALLYQYLPSTAFADAFLHALHLPSKGAEEKRSPQISRSRSCSVEKDDDDDEEEEEEEEEEEATSLAFGVQSLFQISEGNVWELFKTLNAVSRTVTTKRDDRFWQLPPLKQTKKGHRGKRARTIEIAGSSFSTAWDTLQELTEAHWSSTRWNSDQVDNWSDTLDMLQNYRSERCWRLLDLLVAAWHTQGHSMEERNGMVKDPKRIIDNRNQLGKLHLVQQLQFRTSRMPLDDVGDTLDVVFGALCDLEGWAEQQPSRLRTSPERRARKAETAGKLFSELARLSRLGAVDPSALTRGVKERLLLASTSALAVFTSIVNCDQTASTLIAKACEPNTWAANPLEVPLRFSGSPEDSLVASKELANRLLREGVSSLPIKQYSSSIGQKAFARASRVLQATRHLQLRQTYIGYSERTGKDSRIPGHSRIDLIALEQSLTALESEIDDSRRISGDLSSSLSSSKVPPMQQNITHAGAVANAANANAGPPEVASVGLGPDTPDEVPLRKSGRQVKSPVRTGLRRLPQHGMSIGKPPFRKEKEERGSSLSVSPSKTSASPDKEMASAASHSRGRGGAVSFEGKVEDATMDAGREEAGEGKNAGDAYSARDQSHQRAFDLIAWLDAQSVQGLASLRGSLRALLAAEDAAAAASAA